MSRVLAIARKPCSVIWSFVYPNQRSAVFTVLFDIGLVAGLSLLIAFAGASFDIAYDAYAVEVLTREEHGWAVGTRSALYRAGMLIAGYLLISLGPLWGWRPSIFPTHSDTPAAAASFWRVSSRYAV